MIARSTKVGFAAVGKASLACNNFCSHGIAASTEWARIYESHLLWPAQPAAAGHHHIWPYGPMQCVYSSCRPMYSQPKSQKKKRSVHIIWFAVCSLVSTLNYTSEDNMLVLKRLPSPLFSKLYKKHCYFP